MIATTEEGLHDLIVPAILGMSPRLTYKGAEEWRYYEDDRKGPARTRDFRLIWGIPQLRRAGAMFGSILEHEVELRVRTDYAGRQSKTQFIVADDHVHLRDVLSGLKAGDNGIQIVEPIRVETRGYTEDDDVTQIDHVFRVRYMRSVDP